LSKQVCEKFSSKKLIYWVIGRWTAILLFFLTVLTPPALAGGTYKCFKPIIQKWHVLANPTGRWKAWHNTNNWTYKAVPGLDYFQKNSNSSKRIYLWCPNWLAPNTQMAYKGDVDGNSDKCVRPNSYSAVNPNPYSDPTCKLGHWNSVAGHYVTGDFGACYNAGNYDPPSGVPPQDFVVPFDNTSYCPQGGTLKFLRYGSTSGVIKTRNADKLNSLNGNKLSCPAGEKHSVQTKTTLQDAPWGAGVGQFVFNIPSHATKAYFSASVKPTANVTPYLSERLGFAITDSEAGGSGNHWYYPTTGGPKDIGFTAYSLGNNARNNAIFQDRWEVEVVPNFVHFGIPINTIHSSGAGSSTKIVAGFSKVMGSSPRTIVAKGKLEYCAELKLIKGEDLGHVSPALPTEIGTGENNPNGPVETKTNPICQRGETRFSVGSKTPKNWQARTVSKNGKSIVCAKFKQREIPKVDVPPIKIIPKKPDVELPYKKPVFKCRKGERLYKNKKSIPRGWKWRSSVQYKTRVYCAFKPALPALKCARGEKKVRGQIKPPYGWVLLRKKRGKQVVWCLKRDRNARPPRCERGERLFSNLRKIPRGWHKRSIRQGRYTFYCAKQVQKACPKGYRAVGRRCIKDVIFKFPKPPHLIPGLSPKHQPRRDDPRQKKCPRGTRAYKGQCVKG